MSICFIKYVLEHLEDEDIIDIYKLALKYSEKHVQKIQELLKGEDFPISRGFTEEDVDIHTSRLFQDPFYLHYMYIMTLQGITGYALSLSTSIRSNIRIYYTECNREVTRLFDKTIDALLTKGLFSRPPVITPPQSVEFVNRQSFLTGWLGNGNR